MPQLDILTFFSQFFWLSIFFLSFYVLLVKYYLPRMSRILKIRNRKISSDFIDKVQSGSTVSIEPSTQQGEATAGRSHPMGLPQLQGEQSESKIVQKTVDTLLINGIKHSFDFFQEKSKNTFQWIYTSLEITNKIQLQNINHKYLITIGNLQIQDLFLFYHLKAVLAPSTYEISGIKKIFSRSNISKGFTAKPQQSPNSSTDSIHKIQEKFFNFVLFEKLTSRSQ